MTAVGEAAFLNRRAILSLWVDALCTGGISILVVGLFLSWSQGAAPLIVLAQFSALSFLLNWPHFVGAYQLLYATRDLFAHLPPESKP